MKFNNIWKMLKNRCISLLCALALVLSYANVEAQLTTTFTRPVQECDVATSESGVIVETFIEEGSVVRQGQILARLNDTTLQEAKRLAELRANSTVRIRSAQSNVEMKKSHANGLKDLLDKGHGNQREVDLANMQLETALAEHELAIQQQKEAQVELAKIQAELELRIIRSPMDGIVSNVFKEPGEYIAANDPIFCNIVRTDKLRADFYLDVNSFEMINDQSELLLRIGQVKSTDSGDLVKARLVFRSPTLDPKSETVRISVEFDNGEGKYLSGIRCALVLNNGALHSASSPLRGN